MIRAVFFDVGGTLIRPWPSVGAVYARVGRQFGFNATDEAMEQAFRSAWKTTKTTGPLTTSDKNWWRALVAKTLALQGLEDRPGYFEALYEAFVLPDAWRVLPGVVPALKACRGRHVGVISNWDERLRPLLTNLELLQYFDSLTISCEVGVEKPDARMFQTALRSAGVAAGEALHVGDSPVEDVEGARACGLTARLVEANELLPVISAAVCA
ncbi:MAG: HAD-IA family hydrolase [Verrucomicrobiota bacterium]